MIHYKKHDRSLIIDLPVCMQRINHYSKRVVMTHHKRLGHFLNIDLTVCKERVNHYSKHGDGSL